MVAQQALIDGALPAAQQLNVSITAQLDRLLPLIHRASATLASVQAAGGLDESLITAIMDQLAGNVGSISQELLDGLAGYVNSIPQRTSQRGDNSTHSTGSDLDKEGNTNLDGGETDNRSDEAAIESGSVPAT